ncbi:MAG TPA: amidohydrolase family protein [Tissierellia bacterium]|nr:amidohydrolase family protein [Tissierellia bacterium]
MDEKSITISSDAFGSQPRFDEEGNTIGLTYMTSETLLTMLKALLSEDMPLETALLFFTKNPARVLGLDSRKGVLTEGADADVVILDDEMNITHVIAKGKVAMEEGEVLMKGRFEV